MLCVCNVGFPSGTIHYKLGATIQRKLARPLRKDTHKSRSANRGHAERRNPQKSDLSNLDLANLSNLSDLADLANLSNLDCRG